jgi:two-component system, NarL family, sensor kinase
MTDFKLKLIILSILIQLSTVITFAQNNPRIDSLSKLTETELGYNEYYKVRNEIGNYFVETGQYQKGLETYFMLLKSAEREKDYASVALLYNNIATVYRETGKNDLVYKYAYEAVGMIKYVKNDSHKADIHNTLANYYYANYIDSLALIHFNLSHKYRLKAGIKKDIAVSWKNLGGIMYEIGNTELAIEYVHTSLKIRREINDKHGLISSFLCLGEIYYYEELIDSSLFYFNSGVEMIDSTISPFVIKQLYDGIALAYEEKADFKNAYLYLQKLIVIKDSILNIENNKQITELNTRYSTEKKEKEIVLKTYELQKQKDRNLINAVIFSAAGLLLILVFGFVFLRFRQRQRQKLEREMAQQEKLRFKAVIESEEKERIRIAKELHDGLGQLLSTAKLNMSGLEGSLPSDDEKLLNNSMTLLDDAVNEVRSISHNLMPTALINYDIVKAIDSLCDKINNADKINVIFDHDNFSISLTKESEITLYRIIQEVINNMIKHSETSKIEILLQSKVQTVMLKIKDYGKGFDTVKVSESSGIGWQSVLSRVSMLNGKAEIESKAGNGTEINLVFTI